tara:strand:- start:75 stop:233 length:159 start_codon:yes stop_codon:yes gene_type:complete
MEEKKCEMEEEEYEIEEKEEIIKCRLHTCCFILFILLVGYLVYDYIHESSLI